MRYQRRDSFPIVLTSPISDKATTTIAENRDITTIPLHRCFLHQVQTPIQQARPNPNLVDPSQQLPALSQAHTNLPNYQSSFLLATTPHNPPLPSVQHPRSRHSNQTYLHKFRATGPFPPSSLPFPLFTRTLLQISYPRCTNV